MKYLENSLNLRKIGYLLHDYIYRPIKIFQFKVMWNRTGVLSIFDKLQNKPRILYISLINGGGLKKHLNDLTHGMTDTYDVWILYDDNILWHWEDNKWKAIRYFNITLDNVIWLVAPDIIHIHQLSRYLDELNTLVNLTYKNAKLIVTIHDLYYVCPHFFMTECLGTKFCHPSLCNKDWRNIMHKMLCKCHTIVCPSRGIQDVLTFYYPDIEGRCIIIEHGIERVFHDGELSS